ncbi:hypothetical protein QAD02_018892 [Eretmocerus hayati]|uniref:Uncharacterized protein n=1 Tax=Eretmocerus hayati TaxID=131215 RepID=A0ACC2PMS5_9HYME|nr:hypothetical protein QAD02_018892 [Eretmocerus hayati]
MGSRHTRGGKKWRYKSSVLASGGLMRDKVGELLIAIAIIIVKRAWALELLMQVQDDVRFKSCFSDAAFAEDSKGYIKTTQHICEQRRRTEALSAAASCRLSGLAVYWSLGGYTRSSDTCSPLIALFQALTLAWRHPILI